MFVTDQFSESEFQNAREAATLGCDLLNNQKCYQAGTGSLPVIGRTDQGTQARSMFHEKSRARGGRCQGLCGNFLNDVDCRGRLNVAVH